MDSEFVLVEIVREIQFVRLMIEKKDAQQASREEIQELLELVERLERLLQRFLARC